MSDDILPKQLLFGELYKRSGVFMELRNGGIIGCYISDFKAISINRSALNQQSSRVIIN